MGAAREIVRRVNVAMLERFASRRVDVSLAAPACSITFDDVPRSAVTNGVPLLRQHGVKATFYVASGLRPEDGFLSASDIRGLVSDGFDVGCHTFSHYSLYAGSVSGLAADAERNRVAFEQELGVPRAVAFSYPFGEVSVSAKRSLRAHYATLRSVYRGINGLGTDLLLLRANPVFSHAIRWEEVTRLLNTAVQQSGWVIFYTHGVESDPDKWSCTPEDLDRLIVECRRAGMAIRTVRSVSEDLQPS